MNRLLISAILIISLFGSNAGLCNPVVKNINTTEIQLLQNRFNDRLNLLNIKETGLEISQLPFHQKTNEVIFSIQIKENSDKNSKLKTDKTRLFILFENKKKLPSFAMYSYLFLHFIELAYHDPDYIRTGYNWKYTVKHSVVSTDEVSIVKYDFIFAQKSSEEKFGVPVTVNGWTVIPDKIKNETDSILKLIEEQNSELPKERFIVVKMELNKRSTPDENKVKYCWEMRLYFLYSENGNGIKDAYISIGKLLQKFQRSGYDPNLSNSGSWSHYISFSGKPCLNEALAVSKEYTYDELKDGQ